MGEASFIGICLEAAVTWQKEPLSECVSGCDGRLLLVFGFDS